MSAAAPAHSPRSWWLRAVDPLAPLFFPDDCRVCREPLAGWTAAPVCAECLAGLRPLAAMSACNLCGLPLDAAGATPGALRCQRCAAGEYAFDAARSYGAYDGALREVIHLLKYQRMRPLARPLARYLAGVLDALNQAGWSGGSPLLVPVPLAPERLRKRGFNQAELLAREVARLARLPLAPGAVRRSRSTSVQTGLTRAQRFDNMRGAFAPGPRAAQVSGRGVVLVDDVFTTGATLSACARALSRAGAKSVAAITLARTL